MFKKIFPVILLMLFITQSSFPFSGKKYKNFTLKDYTGREVSLSNFKGDRAIVVMFISTRCPVSNAYNGRMAELHSKYHKKGVAFVAINSNRQESVEEIREHATKNHFEFPILKDKNNIIADRFGASFTPEIYVLNGNFEQLYHGRIDDSRREKDVKVSDLSSTLDEILAGKDVSVRETKAFGCTIKRIKK